MDVKVDLGDNTTQLIEQLATQLNMTVDRVFPYYVKMVQVNALAGFVIWICFFVLVAIVLKIHWKQGWEDGGGSDFTPSIILCFASVAACLFLFLGVLFEGSSTISHLLAPEPYAIKALVADAGKLIGK